MLRREFKLSLFFSLSLSYKKLLLKLANFETQARRDDGPQWQ